MRKTIVGLVAVALLTVAGPTHAFAYHERGRCYDEHDCRRGHDSGDDDQRDDNRRAGISPGPFDRSPVDIHDNRLVVCFPFSKCDGKDDGSGDGQQPGPVPGGE